MIDDNKSTDSLKKNGYKAFQNNSSPSFTTTVRLPRALFLLAIIGALLLFIFYQHLSNGSNYKLYYTLLKAVPAEKTCRVPDPDPYDKSIQKYLESAKPLVCKKLQAELTYLNDSGWLIYNTTTANESGYSNLKCEYQCFDRKEETDDVTLEYGPWIEFKDPVQPNCQFVHVQCSHRFPAISIYTNLHNQVIVNDSRLQEINSSLSILHRKERDKGRIPNVILFVLDSVSRSNFIRNLPKTLKVLKEQYGATVFEGLTKVGDNSFPNAVAFMAGKRVQTAGYQSELPDDMSKTFFDDWPLIWKDFHNAGYVTFYAEDFPNFNLFKYLALGFQAKPTDQYFRPYWLQLWGSFLHRRSSHLCYGNNKCHMLQLRYLQQFLTKYDRNQPKFVLNWMTELGHDWLNQVGQGDDDIAKFFSQLHPYLSDSFVFVLSDHGHRFDAIRESVIGRIEERMPFFAMAVPQWLKRERKNLAQVLKGNSQIVCSFFDLHHTLRDILMGPSEGWNLSVQRNWTLGSARFQSLLRPLDPNRSCMDAGIPEDFCVCQQETMVNVTDPKVIKAANSLMKHINSMLKDYPNQCAQLNLLDIRNAQTFLPNVKMVMDPTISIFYGGKNPTGFYINYRIMIQAGPSNGLFEGTLRNSVRDGTFTVIGDVNRINKYGNQSSCVKNALLRKYCYCVI